MRAVLKHLGLEGMEVHHDADIPARAGMGTSSAFTVGLLNACHALLGRRTHKEDLALEAIHVEQNILKETVGSQDQVAAAFGGLNHITFRDGSGRDAFAVDRLPLPDGRLDEFHRHLMLVFTRIPRTASEVADSFVPGLDKNGALSDAARQVENAIRILESPGPIEPFGELLHEAWMAKRGLSAKVSTPEIDGYYSAAREAGAIGGKLLGAGGGGFLLLFARPQDHRAIEQRLGLLRVPFRFEHEGSRVIVYDPDRDAR